MSVYCIWFALLQSIGIIQAIAALLVDGSTSPVGQNTLGKSQLGNLSVMYSLHVPTDLPGSGRIVAIFTDDKAERTEALHVKAGSRVETSAFPQLSFVTYTTTVYLQRRGEGTTRTVVSPRARISWLRELDTLSGAELAAPADHVDEHKTARLTASLWMASWVSDNHTQEILRRVGDEFEEAAPENSSGITSLLEACTRELEVSFRRQLMSFMTRDIAYSPRPVASTIGATFQSITDFLSKYDNSSNQFKISENGYPIDFQIDALEGAPLVVVLHGRRGPKVKLPYLSGAGIVEGLEVSRLAISDPSLYISDEVTIGWHAGNFDQPQLQRDLSELVQGISEKLDASRVIFFGGSAGGFASLILSHLVSDSIAIVWNPQTDITKYHASFVNKYVSHAWGNHAALATSGVRTNAADLYQQSYDSKSHVLYLQQATDVHHVDEHLKPFVEATAGNDHVHYSVQNWGEGHVPPPRPVLRDMLQLAIHPNFLQLINERIDFWTS